MCFLGFEQTGLGPTLVLLLALTEEMCTRHISIEEKAASKNSDCLPSLPDFFFVLRSDIDTKLLPQVRQFVSDFQHHHRSSPVRNLALASFFAWVGCIAGNSGGCYIVHVALCLMRISLLGQFSVSGTDDVSSCNVLFCVGRILLGHFLRVRSIHHLFFAVGRCFVV